MMIKIHNPHLNTWDVIARSRAVADRFEREPEVCLRTGHHLTLTLPPRWPPLGPHTIAPCQAVLELPRQGAPPPGPPFLLSNEE
jgi:hypothetical protein